MSSPRGPVVDWLIMSVVNLNRLVAPKSASLCLNPSSSLWAV